MLRVRLICAIKLVSLSLSYLIDSSTVKLTEAESVRCHVPATVEGSHAESSSDQPRGNVSNLTRVLLRYSYDEARGQDDVDR